MAQAKEDGAEQKAPYEYAKAVEYLSKARQDAAHAYFETAVDWGRRSEDCSQKAIARATQPNPTKSTADENQAECGEP